jgi:tRNA(Ile)-lysidine synthase
MRGRAGDASLPAQVASALARALSPGTPLLLALSGGRDSTLLLHLLRFGAGGRPLPGWEAVTALHVDHGMRSGSRGDAHWVRGLCTAWDVPLRLHRLDPPPRSESEAREARYRLLARVAREEGCGGVVLAHHAGDQAETVLFRLLRGGAGPRGLAGIPAVRPLGPWGPEGREAPRVIRPLLEARHEAMEAWARHHRVPRRVDPTNLAPGPARNRIRNRILPALERVEPGFGEELLALAAVARAREEGLARLLEGLLQRVRLDPGRRVPGDRGPHVSSDPGGARVQALDRTLLLRLPDALLAELLRAAIRGGGGRLSRRGTEDLVRFVRQGESGRRLEPGPGVRVVRDFDTLLLSVSRVQASPAEGAAPDVPTAHRALMVPSRSAPAEPALPTPELLLEGSAGEGRWAPAGPSGPAWEARWWTGGTDPDTTPAHRISLPVHLLRLPSHLLHLPLRLRGRRPGDRIRVSLAPDDRGSPSRRRLKKLLTERRVSRGDRDHLPLLVDGEGLVIWVPGVWASRVPPGHPRNPWTLELTELSRPHPGSPPQGTPWPPSEQSP